MTANDVTAKNLAAVQEWLPAARELARCVGEVLIAQAVADIEPRSRPAPAVRPLRKARRAARTARRLRVAAFGPNAG